MKLLLDENISAKLVPKLQADYPRSAHIKDFGLEQHMDIDIWTHAQRNDFVIVTRDIDFFELGLVKGFPPKIIWIQADNPTSRYVEELLLKNKAHIEAFAAESQTFCLRLL